MKTQVFYGVATRIIILFLIGMFATFIPNYLREFFNDTLHNCANCDKWCNNINDIDYLYDWGIRHYWYHWMMVTLFMLALLNLIISIVHIVNKNYDTSEW